MEMFLGRGYSAGFVGARVWQLGFGTFVLTTLRFCDCLLWGGL